MFLGSKRINEENKHKNLRTHKDSDTKSKLKIYKKLLHVKRGSYKKKHSKTEMLKNR